MSTKIILIYAFALFSLAACNPKPDMAVQVPNASPSNGNYFVAKTKSGNYKLSDDIQVTLTFHKKLKVQGSPYLIINIGGQEHKMKYLPSTNSDELIFNYTVQEQDLDQDGIEFDTFLYFEKDSIQLASTDDNEKSENIPNEIRFTEPTIIYIDSFIPYISHITVPESELYFKNDDVDFYVHFNEEVVVTGSPRLIFEFDGQIIYADYAHGSHTNKILFRLIPDEQHKRISGLTLLSKIDLAGGEIYDYAGNLANLSFLPPQLSELVMLPSAPVVNEVIFSDAKKYFYGEVIDIFLNYDQAIQVKENPRLILLIGDNKQYANFYDLVSEDKALFKYKVAQGDFDDNGIELYSAMDFSTGTIFSKAGEEASSKLNFATEANILVDAKCFGEYATPLPDDYTKAIEITIQRLRILSRVNPEQRGCVNLDGADLTSIYLNKMFELPMRELNFENVKIKDANLSEIDLSKVDLSKVEGLEAWQLNSAISIYAMKLPMMDLSELDTYERNLMFVDFRLTSGLRLDQLEQAQSYEGAVLPEYLKEKSNEE